MAVAKVIYLCFGHAWFVLYAKLTELAHNGGPDAYVKQIFALCWGGGRQYHVATTKHILLLSVVLCHWQRHTHASFHFDAAEFVEVGRIWLSLTAKLGVGV